MKMDWIPGKRCGPFAFGEPLPPLDSVSLTLLEPSCEGANWQTYRVGDGEAQVSVEDGVITRVECVKSARHLGKSELVGSMVESLPRILGIEVQLTREWSDGTAMYEAPCLGLTLWVEHDRVESVTTEVIGGEVPD